MARQFLACAALLLLPEAGSVDDEVVLRASLMAGAEQWLQVEVAVRLTEEGLLLSLRGVEASTLSGRGRRSRRLGGSVRGAYQYLVALLLRASAY